MADKVGDVYYVAHIRGDNLNKEARKLGGEAGDEARKGFSDRFSKLGQELVPELRRQGRLNGKAFTNAFENAITNDIEDLAQKVARIFSRKNGLDEFAKGFDRVDDAAKELRDDFKELNRHGELNEQMWGRLGGTLNQWLGNARKVEAQNDAHRDSIRELGLELDRQVTNFDRVQEAYGKLETVQKRVVANTRQVTETQRRLNRENEYGVSLWHRLSANTRQWTLIIGAILSSGEHLANLLAGAGAGVFILASAFGALVSGSVVLGVAISGLVKEVQEINKYQDLARIPTEKLTEAQKEQLATLRKQIKAYDDVAFAIAGLGEVFSRLRDSITTTVFAGLADEFREIGTVLVPAMEGSILKLADSVNSALNGLFARLFEPDNIALFNRLIEDAGPLFEDLVNAAGDLILVLLEISDITSEFTRDFTRGLSVMIRRWRSFTESAEGRNSIVQFFEDATFILGKFGDLLAGSIDLIGNLITPETVQKTGEFLDHLTNSLPFLQQVFELLNALDPFGIIAEILDVVGNALSPTLAMLEPLLATIRTLIEAVLPGLGLVLQVVGFLNTPLKILFEYLATFFGALQEYFAPVATALSDVFTALQETADAIWEEIKPAVDELIAVFIDLLPEPEELARILREDVIPWIRTAGDIFIRYFVPAIKDVIKGFETMWRMFAPFLAAAKIFADGLVRAFTPIYNFVMDLIGAFMRLIGLMPNLQNAVRIDAPQASGSGRGGRFAAGGVVNRATLAMIGEAGRELVVPMERPLSQVDPAVRPAAALLRGDSTAGGVSKTVTIGSITTITPAKDPAIVTSMVMDQIIAEALN